MARAIRGGKIETRNSRLGLIPRKAPYWASLGPGRKIGYRRPMNRSAGAWVARYRDEGKASPWREKAIGEADDYKDADGFEVLNFRQAQGKALEWFDRQVHEARLVKDGAVPRRGPLTVAEAMGAYLDDMDRNGKKSASDARKRVALHVLPSLGDALVEDLTRIRLEKWRDALAASPKGKRQTAKPAPKNPRKPEKHSKPKPAAPRTADEKRARKATANRVLATLKAALTYAVDRGLVICPDTAWTKTKPYRGTEEPRQAYLTPEEQQRLLNAIRDGDFKHLVAGALATGCRYGELARMTVGDFDPTGGTVLVAEAKSGKPRRVPLTEQGRSFFESITAGRARKELIFTREAYADMRRVDPETRMPLEKVRRAWKPSEQTRLMSEACRAAGLPVMGFHQLRHSYASALVAAGMPLAFVAQLTGHADTRMLERHYAHLAPSDVKKALEAFAPGLDLGTPAVEPLKIKRG